MHNSLVVQTKTGAGSTFVTLTGGGACPGPGRPGDAAPVGGVHRRPDPACRPTGTGRRTASRTGGTIVKFYNHYQGGTVPYAPDGTAIATFGVSKLSSSGACPPVRRGGPAGPDHAAVLQPAGRRLADPVGRIPLRDGNTVYIYGTQSPKLSAPGHLLYLVRVPVSRLTEFSAWHSTSALARGRPRSPTPGRCRPAQTRVRLQRRPCREPLLADPGRDGAGRTGHRRLPGQRAVGPVRLHRRPAAVPDPAIGLDAAHDYRILYEARAEPALSTRNTLVISYNVNSEAVTTGCVPMSAFTNALTLPRFVAVPMAVFGDGAGARASQARSGPSGYPQIVQQNPSQWFDAWSYAGGCPPVPALTSARARPAAGGSR